MEVSIYSTSDGPEVTVKGDSSDSPDDVAKAYKDIAKELNKEGEK